MHPAKFMFGSASDGPHALYHYTSYEALISILTTRELWASNVHYMSDGSEFGYAFQRARLRLQEIWRDEPEADRSEYIDLLRKTLDTYDHVNVFVVSFSETGDLLSQWRAYCPPAQGVSVGFAESELRAAADAQDFTIVKCLYEADEQRHVIDQWLKQACEAYDAVRPTTKEVKSSLAHRFALAFTMLAPQFKDPAFAEEREWRLISQFRAVHHERVEFRQGRSFVIPYFRFHLPETDGHIAVGRFVVGPTPHPKLALASLGDLATAKRVRWEGTVVSKIPYRTW